MKRPKSNFILQSGVIPYRFDGGTLEVALVTASSGTRWGIPKGHVQDGMSLHESAAKEAFEESGVLGEVMPICVGSYIYVKDSSRYCVDLFPLAVVRTLKRWPEMDRRRRAWLRVPKAARRVDFEELRECILALPEILGSQARQTHELLLREAC